MLIPGLQDPCHHLLKDLQGEGVEEIAPVHFLRHFIAFRLCEDEVRLYPGDDPLPVLQRFRIDPLIILDPNILRLGPVRQEEAHAPLSAAVVQHRVLFPEETAVRQPLQHAVGRGLVGMVIFIRMAFVPAAAVDPQKGILCEEY